MDILDLSTPLLGRLAAVPQNLPFTTAAARAAGLTARDLSCLVTAGVLRHPLRGVHVATGLVDDLQQRIRILSLVVPSHAVVTDRTAGWLWGANMILAPNDHLVVPAVSVFCPPGLRLRNGLVGSGERVLRREDVVEMDGGLRVTTPLRTACDLGRLLHRDQALAAMDSLARLAIFTVEELVLAVRRYRGFRGVIQLRTLSPLVDPRAESPGESILRLRWWDAGLPRPQCQVAVPTPWGTSYVVDIGLPDLRFGAEYDGAAFHDEDREPHDEQRRLWLRTEAGWHLVVTRRANIHGYHQDVHETLAEAYRVRLNR